MALAIEENWKKVEKERDKSERQKAELISFAQAQTEGKQWDQGEDVSPGNHGIVYLREAGHGARGIAIVVGDVIKKGKDYDQKIKVINEYSQVKELIDSVETTRDSWKGSDKNVQSNRTRITIMDRAMSKLEDFIVMGPPVNSNKDVRALSGDSEIKLMLYKFIDKKRCETEADYKEEKDDMYLAAALSSRLEHPNIMRYFGVIPESSKGAGYLCEYVDGKTLESIIEDKAIREVRDIPDKKVVYAIGYFLYDVLDYMHKQGLCYQDVQLDNLMITEDGEFKLTDLGTIREFKPGLVVDEFLGDYEYSPYEVIKDLIEEDGEIEIKSGRKVRRGSGRDVFGAAVLMYKLATRGKNPFLGRNDDEYTENVRKGKPVIHSILKNDYDEDTELKTMFEPFRHAENPENRVTAAQMRDKMFGLLRDTGYDCPSKIQEILRDYVKPIYEERKQAYAAHEAAKIREKLGTKRVTNRPLRGTKKVKRR
ncbi:protein kinase [Nanoarchaeota archaeon]